MKTKQDTPLVFDPLTGERLDLCLTAYEHRTTHPFVAWLYNPWTGNKRRSEDIHSDSMGRFIAPPGEPVMAAEIGEKPYAGNTVDKATAHADSPCSALDIQVAGNHYKCMKIQPVEFIHVNNIPYLEGNVIKYVARWRSKGGIHDLEKAKHYIDLLIELEGKAK